MLPYGIDFSQRQGRWNAGGRQIDDAVAILCGSLNFAIHLTRSSMSFRYADAAALENELPFSFGQCVELVKHYARAPATFHWREGRRVLDEPNLPIGTAIATFVNGRYRSLPHGPRRSERRRAMSVSASRRRAVARHRRHLRGLERAVRRDALAGVEHRHHRRAAGAQAHPETGNLRGERRQEVRMDLRSRRESGRHLAHMYGPESIQLARKLPDGLSSCEAFVPNRKPGASATRVTCR